MPYFSGPNGIREVADPGERFLQSFQDSRRKRLLSDFFTSGQTDLGQLARLDPEAAQQIQAQQKQQGLAKMFADLYAAPEAERPKGIAALLGADLQTGQQAMKAFDPRFQQASAANGVQSTFINDRGERVAIMRDGSVQVLGNNAPNNQIIDTGNGYYGVNKGNLSAAPVQVGGQQAAPTMQAASGEVPFSIDPSLPPEVQAAIRANPQQWGEAPDGAQMQVPQQLRKAPPAMTPYQQAQLSLQEQAAKRAENADKRAQAEAERKAANPINAQAQREQAAIRAKVPQLQNAIRGMDRIETALKGLQGKMVNTGPMDAMVQRYTPAGQELEAAVGAIQNSVLALTRVPGIGSQSDLEARIAALQYPSLDKPPEVNRRTLDNLKLFMRDLANAYKLAVQPGQGQQAPAKPASGGALRYNPATGDFD